MKIKVNSKQGLLNLVKESSLDEQNSFEILKHLALEIHSMNEIEQKQFANKINVLKLTKRTNTVWLNMAYILLTKPEVRYTALRQTIYC